MMVLSAAASSGSTLAYALGGEQRYSMILAETRHEKGIVPSPPSSTYWRAGCRPPRISANHRLTALPPKRELCQLRIIPPCFTIRLATLLKSHDIQPAIPESRLPHKPCLTRRGSSSPRFGKRESAPPSRAKCAMGRRSDATSKREVHRVMILAPIVPPRARAAMFVIPNVTRCAVLAMLARVSL